MWFKSNWSRDYVIQSLNCDIQSARLCHSIILIVNFQCQILMLISSANNKCFFTGKTYDYNNHKHNSRLKTPKKRLFLEVF